MAQFKAVLFDWDGTLNDSVMQNYAVYGEIFTFLGLPPLSYGQFREDFEADYHAYYLKKGVPPSRLHEMDALWHTSYAKYSDSVTLTPGAAELVAALKRKGVLLGVVSNGFTHRIRGEMKKHGVDSHLQTLVTFDDIPELKPSPAGILHALKLLNVKACDAVYVGDMVEDVRAGKNAGVKTIAVPTGMHSKERLFLENPDYLFLEIRELLKLF